MTTDRIKAGRARAIDAALKAAFDAKAREPAPERLVDLATRLAAPAEAAGKFKAG